ncbi:hypothetical protein C1882_29095, partial [Pseudomonas sp. FW305-E2]|uniref:ATP-binding cassette domain-containing protein n=1 Tax=Pseudomonas sp. FW305-E2 TaxID=2075558 RepID=UPI000CD39114
MIVHCSQVSKSFDGGKTFAIRNLTVDIQEGEFIAVIGLSGAGKSTFLRLLNGTINADAGQLTVFG